MRILLVGASGFIGRHLLTALVAAGHHVIATYHRGAPQALPGVQWQALDLLRLIEEPAALTWPANTDLLINASGALSTDLQYLDRLQHRAACALFDQAQANGAAVLQISALGAGDQPDVPFLATKAAADNDLLRRGMPAVVLRPSLVVGSGGTSSRWLQRLSPAPLIPLLNTNSRMQPVHIDDLCAAVLALIRQWPTQPCTLPLVGAQVMTLGGLIDELRHAQGWAPGRYVVLPRPLARLGASLGDRLGWTALNRQTLRLAERDNLANADELAQACSYRAASVRARLVDWPVREQSLTLALEPLLLATLLLIWLGTAAVCLGPGFDWGLRIMAELGVSGWLAKLAVASGAVFDGLLGLGLLFKRWRRLALLTQIALMAGYTLVITVGLPHYWADPFMATGKNVAVLLLSVWWFGLQPSRRKTAGDPRG